MPRTLFQEIIFTLIMVFVMVYAMVCYNIAINLGGLSNEVFLLAFKELPIMYVIAFIVEFFVVGKLVKKLAFKTLDPSKTGPIFIILTISSLTVCFMCPIMSFIASLLFNYTSAENIVSTFIQIAILNFPMALFWQLCYAGPFVRFIFRKIFKKQLQD